MSSGQAGGDRVDRDAAAAELEREVAAEVDDGGLAGAVAVGAGLAERADAEAGDRRRDDDAAGVVARRPHLQQRRKVADRREHGLDVEVHDLGEGPVGVAVERLAPRRARVGEQQVHVRRVLLDRRQQRRDALGGGNVGGRRDGDGAGREVRERVELFAGRVAGCRFAGRDEDLGGAGLQDAGGFAWAQVSACGLTQFAGWRDEGREGRKHDAYADAACRPRPREPPVMTATLPLREKREG
ncbi:hypothetical protein BN1708_004413 [Verticillium longisporum]|uniref:Uncharacterized protein n=1 Tax=Verticillium longisporum TaxID=100787 RepID=A0A0G4LZM1_VERLO|nr:hypothetical protein BN1708_004413 [Verticillium longisporum]